MRKSRLLLFLYLPQTALQHRPQLLRPELHVGIGPKESRVNYIGDPRFDLLLGSDMAGHGNAVPAAVP